jgi:hypothetical protein
MTVVPSKRHVERTRVLVLILAAPVRTSCPLILATHHGSTFVGDGARALRDLVLGVRTTYSHAEAEDAPVHTLNVARTAVSATRRSDRGGGGARRAALRGKVTGTGELRQRTHASTSAVNAASRTL